MKSFRFARRSFLAGVGGAVGLKILLRNMIATAQDGMTSPPRFLMMHWPVGTVHYKFRPSSTGMNWSGSEILQPFIDANLQGDMTVLYGLTHEGLSCPGGGGHEAGTPFMTTGASAEGTRSNGGEADDGTAGGPSFDQIFLENVPDLQRPGSGYLNLICDARVDSQETSTQCLSYSHATRQIASANPGGQITENTPLLPELSPVQAYANLFSDFMPGGSEVEGNVDAAFDAIMAKQSVLDYSLAELEQLTALAPAETAAQIDSHAEAIRNAESLLGQSAGAMGAAGCEVPAEPDGSLIGKTGSRFDYENPVTNTSDKDLHEQIGYAHMSVIQAAFLCDLIRVATFQWSPGTNHVSFDGLFPNNESAIYMHHPVSHRIGSRNDVVSSQPGGELGDIVDFLVNVQAWYYEKTSNIINNLKNATDAWGGNLLAQTVIPMVTEVAETTHSRSPLQGIIFGGSALGMQHGQYIEVNGRHHNDLWMTVAQPLLKTSDPVAALSSEQAFYKNGVGPIDGLWTMPV